jgi:putative sigma-54 modulation protein
MVIEFTGRQVEIAPAVRAQAERKIGKLAKVLPGVTHVRVIIGAEKRRFRAEVTVNSPLADLVANALAADPAAALGAVFDKLTEQVKRVKTRRREAPRRRMARGVATPPVAPAPRPPAEAPGDGRPRVIRSRRFVAKPMTMDEAALLVGGNGDGVLVFRDADTRRISVLFRRRDGNLGLIEPEA